MRGRAWIVAAGALVALAAFAPRVGSLRSALMIDEGLWIERSDRFVAAVTDLRFGDAFTTGHPGVTTMWIGGVAQRTLPDDASLLDRYERARLAMGLVAAALILLLWWLARPLIGEIAAFGGAMLVALDPYVLALTRVLHLDGLHVLTMLVSLVALLRLRRGEAPMLWWSGIFCGLALLTRMLTTIPLILAAFWLLRSYGVRGILQWCAVAAGTFALAWPLVWVRPWKAAWLLWWGGARAAGAESDAGRFFLGANVNPGPLYYPIVWALRASIFTLPAAFAAAVWATRRRASSESARVALVLLAFAAGSVLLLTVANKKADRYVLPSLAATDLAIAIAVVHWFRNRTAMLAATGAAALALHAGPALALHPFELTHFNWAAGGPAAARNAFAIGRGEGLETAARDLSRMLPGATIATSRARQFEEFYDGRVVRLDAPEAAEAGYVLFYISSIQTGRFRDVYERYRDAAPVYTLRLNGLDYVRVWQAR